MLVGLFPGDLPRIEACALIEEAKYFISAYDVLGLGPLPGSTEALSRALADYEAGKHAESISTLVPIRETMISHGLNAVEPMIEEGFANPRNSEIPLDILRFFDLARNQISRGDWRRGELNFIKGLEGLKAIREPTPILVGAFLVISTLCQNRRRKRGSNHISKLIRREWA
jgi:hypothetical protein